MSALHCKYLLVLLWLDLEDCSDAWNISLFWIQVIKAFWGHISACLHCVSAQTLYLNLRHVCFVKIGPNVSHSHQFWPCRSTARLQNIYCVLPAGLPWDLKFGSYPLVIWTNCWEVGMFYTWWKNHAELNVNTNWQQSITKNTKCSYRRTSLTALK